LVNRVKSSASVIESDLMDTFDGDASTADDALGFTDTFALSNRERRMQEDCPRIVKVMRDRCAFRSIANMYRNFNTDPDGELSKAELEAGFNEMGFNLSSNEFEAMWKFVDEDESGGISLSELLQAFTTEGATGIGAGGEGLGDTIGVTDYDRMVSMMTGTSDGYNGDFFKQVSARELASFLRDRMEARSTLKAWFREVDADDSGYIDKKELTRLIEKFSLKMASSEMDSLFDYLDGVGIGSELAPKLVTQGGHVRTGDGSLDLGEVCDKLQNATDEELDKALGRVSDSYQQGDLNFENLKGKSDRMQAKVARLRKRMALDPHTIVELVKADTNRDGLVERSEFIMKICKMSSVYPDSHTYEVASSLFDALDKERRGTLDVRLMFGALQAGMERPGSTVERMARMDTGSREGKLSPAGKANLTWLAEQRSSTGRELSTPPYGRLTPFRRREHNTNSSQTVENIPGTPGYMSEKDRFATSRMKPAGRPKSSLLGEEPLPQDLDREKKSFFTTGRAVGASKTRARMEAYQNGEQSREERRAQAAIHGKTGNKYNYLRAIKKNEFYTDRMEATNLTVMQRARNMQEKMLSRGSLSDPGVNPSPVAWLGDGVPHDLWLKNRDVKEPNGIQSRNVYKWH